MSTRDERKRDAAWKKAKGDRSRDLKERHLEQLRTDVGAVAAADGPVLVGPFTGEVGFELLYWIPLVRWAVREFPRLEGRLVVISRGGAWHWWQSAFDCRYLDILSFARPDEYVRNKGADKQRRPKDYDSEILERSRRRLGIDRAPVLHPSLLFEFYYRVRRVAQNAFADSVTRTEAGVEGLAAIYAPIPKPELDRRLAEILPEEYVAVRFYFRESFPDTAENQSFAARVIENIARKTAVVLLNNGLELDEHSDFSLGSRAVEGRVVTLDHLMRPDDNLHVQTAALSRARAFVGTYGGLSYLAPFVGVPSVGFRSDPQANHPWHTALAERIFETAGWPSLLTLCPWDVPLVELLAGASGAPP